MKVGIGVINSSVGIRRRLTGRVGIIDSSKPTGDTISAIAKHYGVSVASILRWNGLSQEARLRPGDRVRLTELRLSADHRGQNAVR